MKNDFLIVDFFGEFSLKYNDNTIMEKHYQNSKVSLLLKYFLANRSKGFTREHLMDLLYENEETENPINALKIIIHRLRKELDATGISNEEWIENKNGKYYWNPSIPCKIDIENFDEMLEKASKTGISKEKKLEYYISAINVYKGEFLGHGLSDNWAIPVRVHYQQAFIETLKKAFEIIKDLKDYKLLYNIANHGAEIYPLDEEIAFEKISGLKGIGRTKEAIHEYIVLEEMIFNEYGVAPSNQLSSLFAQIKDTTQNIADSVIDVKKFLDEGENEEGAYYCNLENFSDNYKIISRGLERSGLSAFLMLCSIVNEQGKLIENEGKLIEASKILKNATKDALRRGDLYTRYSTSQYIYLLIGINQENCSIVFKRVEENFKKAIKNNSYNIKYKAISALEMSSLIK